MDIATAPRVRPEDARLLVPDASGLYAAWVEDSMWYIGVSGRQPGGTLRQRIVASHFIHSEPFLGNLWAEVKDEILAKYPRAQMYVSNHPDAAYGYAKHWMFNHMKWSWAVMPYAEAVEIERKILRTDRPRLNTPRGSAFVAKMMKDEPGWMR